MTAVAERPGVVLRSYQEQMIRSVVDKWSKAVTPVAGIAATGLGKTVFFSALADRWTGNEVADNGNYARRVLVLVHRDELVQQAVAKLHAVAPHLTVGIVKAAVNEVDRDVVVASVQTLRNPIRMLQLQDVGMVIIDECHHAATESYQSILTHYGCYAKDPAERTPCVGVTATLDRTDGRGLGGVFEDVAFQLDIMFGIKNGYLCDVKGLSVVSEGLDLSKVKRSRGDYQEGALGEVMGDALVCMAIADAYDEHGRESCEECCDDDDPVTWCDCGPGESCKGPCRRRAHDVRTHPLRRGVHFAPTVDSAYAQADAYNKINIPCEVITGDTPIATRAAIYHRFRTGETRILANCMVLTEGWDAPWAEVAVMGRPTQSAPLYQQCVGRVLRPFPGKRMWSPGTATAAAAHNGGRPALVLDVVGVAKMHKLASLVDMSVWTPKPDQTLMEAEYEDDWEQGREAAERTVRGPKWQKDGELAEVDLFGESESAWSQTRKGVWFLDAGTQTLFLWEYPDGSYGVASYVKTDYRGKPAMHESGIPFSLAMSICETRAAEADMLGTFSSKSASWRKKKEPASTPQKDYATRLRITFPDDIGKTELSKLIAVSVASDRIDRYVK